MTDPQPQKPSDELRLLERVLLAHVEEQRRARRWGLFFKLALVIYLGAALFASQAPFREMLQSEGEEKTAVIDVAGVIAPGQPSSADNLMDALKEASEDKKVKGIVLRMNSPGGSPVQSASVYDEIRRIKKDRPDFPIIAVVADLCASGCYYIAAAADKIYVSEASVVGSIGVIMGSFGFVETMKWLGVERRIMTAGEHKALLDPFAPVDPVAKLHMQGLINEVHQQFIAAVKAGRGERLKDIPELFTGLVWNGHEGIALGLADAIGTDRMVAESVIGAKRRVNFNPEEGVLDRLTRKMGTEVAASLVSVLMQGAGTIR